MTEPADDLADMARSAREAAYAPYSGFRVGAALEAEDGRRFAGCNVENAALSVGQCAERTALGAAVTAGARRFRRLFLSTTGEEPASPCGMCRQALAEFGTDLEIASEDASGARRRWILSDLLPDAFRLALLTLLLAGCTEEAITGVGGDDAPGASPPTVEMDIRAGEMVSWRDTTFEGFVLTSSFPALLATDRPDLQARVLTRIGNLPDTVQIDSVRHAVVRFDSAAIRIVLDTLRSKIPATPVRVQVFALTRRFVVDQTSWTQARAGVPWTTPGGDLGRLLGEAVVQMAAGDSVPAVDTVRVQVAQPVDSLLKAWRSTGGGNGIAILVEAGAAELFIDNLALRTEAVHEGIDTLRTIFRSPTAETFIFDPPFPDPAQALRLGGLPAARFYAEFAPPESFGGVPLRDSEINRAVLVFPPLERPAAPFALERTIGATVTPVLADPFVVGPKVPIGEFPEEFVVAPLRLPIALNPDSLELGEPMELEITPLLRQWAVADPDSLPVLRVGISTVPEGQAFGMWEFGSVQSPAALQPLLRVVVTPPAGFALP